MKAYEFQCRLVKMFLITLPDPLFKERDRAGLTKQHLLIIIKPDEKDSIGIGHVDGPDLLQGG